MICAGAARGSLRRFVVAAGTIGWRRESKVPIDSKLSGRIRPTESERYLCVSELKVGMNNVNTTMRVSFYRAAAHEDKDVRIQSKVELARALQDLTERRGAGEFFFAVDGPHLIVAVADPMATLAFHPNSATEPYLVIENSDNAPNDDLVSFNFGNTPHRGASPELRERERGRPYCLSLVRKSTAS